MSELMPVLKTRRLLRGQPHNDRNGGVRRSKAGRVRTAFRNVPFLDDIQNKLL